MRYFVHDKDSGKVLFEGDGKLSDTVLMDFPAGHQVIEAPLDGVFDGYFVVDNVVQTRQLMSLTASKTSLKADGIDEVIVSDIPSGVQVEWPDGQTDIVTGGEIRFSVDLAGTYTFRFTAVPYLDQEIAIEAIAAT